MLYKPVSAPRRRREEMANQMTTTTGLPQDPFEGARDDGIPAATAAWLPTVAITSGKGGVGKTSVAVNLAVALARFQARVALLDADYGLGNADILLGVNGELTLEHIVSGRATIDQVMVAAPGGVRLLPAATGAQELTSLTCEQRGRLHAALAELADTTDVLLVDTATGIADNVVSWLETADQVLVVTSPDPAAVVDAYAVIKLIQRLDPAKRLEILVNDVSDEAEARSVHARLDAAVREFLRTELELFGHVVHDPALADAVRRREPIVTLHPDAPASRCFRRLARKLLRRLQTPTAARTQVRTKALEPVAG